MKALGTLIVLAALASPFVGVWVFGEDSRAFGVLLVLALVFVLPFGAALDGDVRGLPVRYGLLVLRTVILYATFIGGIMALVALAESSGLREWQRLSERHFYALFGLFLIPLVYLAGRFDSWLSRRLWHDRPTWRRLIMD